MTKKPFLIKELKETGGNHRVTFSKKELEKIKRKAGDYVRVTSEDDDGE